MRKHEGNGFIEQERDHVPLLDPAIAESLVNFRRAVVGVNHGAPVMRTKVMKHRREIGIAREDDELSEPGRVLKEIANIAGNFDVGAVLELRREWLAVDNLKAGDHEIRAYGCEGMRVVRAVPADENATGIAVAPCYCETAANIVLRRLEPDKPAGCDPAHPFGRISRKTPRCVFALTAQGKVHVVEIDEQRGQADLRGPRNYSFIPRSDHRLPK